MQQIERASREFTRLSGEVSFYTPVKLDTVPGPYTKEKRLKILEKVLKAENQIGNHFSDKEATNLSLISHEELEEIRRIWIEDKNEVEDEVPNIYEKVKIKLRRKIHKNIYPQ